jgi:hypothetical protein
MSSGSRLSPSSSRWAEPQRLSETEIARRMYPMLPPDRDWAEAKIPDHDDTASGSHETRRWREVDSNF